MKTTEALRYYDNDVRLLARALDIWPSAIYQWGDRPPALRQLQLERITGGELIADARSMGGPNADD